MIHVLDARRVRELPQYGRAEAGRAEREPEEEARDHTDTTWNELLTVDHDGGKGGRKDKANHETQCPRPKEVRVRKGDGNRQHAQNGKPNDVLAPDSIPQRPACERPDSHRRRECEEVHLRALYGDVEAMH